MNTVMKSLDTLKVYERLKKVKTSDAQARELAGILGELVDNQLATKTDLPRAAICVNFNTEKRNHEIQGNHKNHPLHGG